MTLMKRIRIYLYLRLPRRLGLIVAYIADHRHRRMKKKAQRYFADNPHINQADIEYKGKVIRYYRRTHA